MVLRIGPSYGLHGLMSFEEISKKARGISANDLNSLEFGIQRCTLNWAKGRPGSPYPSETFCQKLRELNQSLDLTSSVHASYSVVLTSDDPGKTQFAKATMTATARVATYLGATHVTFHCGSRGPGTKGLQRAKNVLKEMLEARDKRGTKIEYSPEVAGKVNSLGSFHEILELAECCGTLFTWDVAHDFARGGQVTTFNALNARLEAIEARLDVSSQRRLPIHISGIVRGKAGERYHTPLKEGDGVPWRLFLSALKQVGFLERCSIICESKARQLSDNWSRLIDTKRIREFCLSNQIVDKWTPKKPALDTFL